MPGRREVTLVHLAQRDRDVYHHGDFCTTLRNGALSRCRSDAFQCQLTGTDLILLSIE